MPIQLAITPVFTLLRASLDSMTSDQYRHPCMQLNMSSVGQHVRHIIEMFQCLEEGYVTGVVNYELRKRDTGIESDPVRAMGLLDQILEGLGKSDKPLLLEGAYHESEDDLLRIPTNYHREIVYNMEHTIHHMALIRIGMVEMGITDVPANYGVAAATVKHRRSCAR
jgi:hypothetical protein